jgi:hypothetical protein
MDHNESNRKFEHLMGREADHAQETAVELGALIAVLPEKSRHLAELQVKTSHQHAREFRELIVKIKES